jgi:hypothetical protein
MKSVFLIDEWYASLCDLFSFTDLAFHARGIGCTIRKVMLPYIFSVNVELSLSIMS